MESVGKECTSILTQLRKDWHSNPTRLGPVAGVRRVDSAFLSNALNAKPRKITHHLRHFL